MKLIFSSVIALFFIISTVVCVVDTAEKIEACLEGITDTNEAVAGIVYDINSLIHTSIKDTKKIQEIQFKLYKDGELALIKYGKFNPECKNITEKYTYKQDTILLKGINPLLSSIVNLYKGLLKQKEKVEHLHMGDLLSGFLKAVTRAVDEFKIWSDKYGSDRVREATSGLIYDIYILIDEVNEVYDFQ